MLAKLSNQLGNQMFIYASVKSIAKEKGYDFGYTMDGTYLMNSVDEKYGNTVYEIFSKTRDEFTSEIPNDYNIYNEPYGKRETNYHRKAYNNAANTVMCGLYQSPLYFDKIKDEVKNWFTFPKDVLEKAIDKKNEILSKYNKKKMVSVHFRQGADYQKLGYALSEKYYKKAIERMDGLIDEDAMYVIFGDKIPKNIKRIFGERKYCVERGSLVDDMCLISLSDFAIVSNSTFSWWGAYLSDAVYVIRPSKYYTFGTTIAPDDIFPANWYKVEAERSVQAKILGIILQSIEKVRIKFKRKFPELYEKIISFVYKRVGIKRKK